MVSVIIPIFYKKKNSFIIKRVYELINLFKDYENFELIFADASKKKYIDKVSSKNIKFIDIMLNNKLFSPAQVRNEAVKYAKNKYLFFFDVDLSFNDNFLEKLIKEINLKIIEEKSKFLMIPCFYLSNKGTNYYEQNRDSFIIEKIRNSFLLGNNDLVERLAINTSAIILEKKYFIEIGMFNKDFFGHGGEDFELLHRLVSLSPKYEKPYDYYEDIVSQFVANYKGFRKYMSHYSLPYLFTDLVLVHKWHERPLFNKFYFKRVKNESLLNKKMLEHDSSENFLNKKLWDCDTKYEDYINFLNNLCLKNGYDPKRYIGFFKYNENVKIEKRPISAKIRKLITRPKMFFKDIKITRINK